MEYTTYLQHHGILGQKWGVRRSTSKSTNIKKKKKDSNLKRYAKYKANQRKEILIGRAKIAAMTSGTMATMYATWAGPEIAKKAIKSTGRKAVESYLKSKGAEDITWLD